ncbi:hypothetical protein D9Q98_001524 [Chlorella vulgaris]|jgi:hypothetical protein|uniref:Uncharacterized protein n=1 Tax=Chlorella vulgaris TaxID=3077 RepID=A0A9D4U0A8_CHLVU|nr:hypothetical protein D9Q98_001524 [Chlorella vulgaris]
MLAWMGGKQRLVARHKAKQRNRGASGGSATAGEKRWRLVQQHEQALIQQQHNAAEHSAGSGAAVAEAAHKQEPEAPPLKRVKTVRHSLDLAALKMPAEWPPEASRPAADTCQKFQHPAGLPMQTAPPCAASSSAAGSQT